MNWINGNGREYENGGIFLKPLPQNAPTTLLMRRTDFKRRVSNAKAKFDTSNSNPYLYDGEEMLSENKRYSKAIHSAKTFSASDYLTIILSNQLEIDVVSPNVQPRKDLLQKYDIKKMFANDQF